MSETIEDVVEQIGLKDKKGNSSADNFRTSSEEILGKVEKTILSPTLVQRTKDNRLLGRQKIKLLKNKENDYQKNNNSRKKYK